jgi:hypothetical protein
VERSITIRGSGAAGRADSESTSFAAPPANGDVQQRQMHNTKDPEGKTHERLHFFHCAGHDHLRLGSGSCSAAGASGMASCRKPPRQWKSAPSPIGSATCWASIPTAVPAAGTSCSRKPSNRTAAAPASPRRRGVGYLMIHWNNGLLLPIPARRRRPLHRLRRRCAPPPVPAAFQPVPSAVRRLPMAYLLSHATPFNAQRPSPQLSTPLSA